METIQLLDIFNSNKSIKQYLLDQTSLTDSKLMLGKYHIVKYLGKGAFAKVFKAVHLQNGKQFALKIIDLLDFEVKYEDQEVRKRLIAYIDSEETNLKKCKSAHIIKLYDSFTNNICKIMVLQYCDGSTLEEYIKKRGGLEQSHAVIILKEIIFGLAVLHRNGIVHRDIKPANILIHKGIFKIADLGFSKQLPQQEEKGVHTILGTKSTMAPQVINHEAYGFKADIWSLGVIFFFMLYYDKDYSLIQNYRRVQTFIDLKQHKKLSKFDTQGHASAMAIDFLSKTLEVNQKKRMNWHQTLMHGVFFRKQQTLPELLNLHKDDQFVELRNINEEPSNDIMNSEEINLKNNEKLMHLQSIKAQEFNPEEKQDYTLLNREYLQCKKAEYLLNKLIIPIDQKHMIDKSQQEHVQMLYLLIVRCKSNIARAQLEVKKHYNQKIATLFSNQVRVLNQRVKLKFENISQILRQAENSIKSMIKERMIKIVNKNSFNDRQRFLTGVEGLDFKRDEQIYFTYEKYIVNIINDIKGNEKEEKIVKSILKAYRSIALISEKQLGSLTLKDYIYQYLLNQVN